MCEEWTGEVVGKMHVFHITAKELANELNWHEKYLSRVLNGHRTPRGAEERIKDAVKKLCEEKARKRA